MAVKKLRRSANNGCVEVTESANNCCEEVMEVSQ